jgi:phospholipase/carboxylesterase
MGTEYLGLVSNLPLVYVVRPASAGRPPHPAIVLLHGLGSSEGDMHLMAQALQPEFYAVSVRAPIPAAWGGYMWYDLDEGPGLGGPSIGATLETLGEFISGLADHFPVDPRRVYLGGFSQGAAMAGAAALLFPDLVMGAIMISGYLPPPGERHSYPPGSGAGRPFFQAHGTRDEVVPVLYARQTRDFLRAIGADLSYHEYPIGHEVSAEELADLQGWMSAVLATATSRP